jgi:biopolymer transport protein ExbD
MKNACLLPILIALLACALPCGCATSVAKEKTTKKQKSPQVTIRMNEQGQIYVGDTKTGLKGLVRHLKRKGYPTSTHVTIEIPQNASSDAMKKIGQTLAAGQYFSMHFTRPRVATAVKAPHPGAPLPKN